MSAHLDCAPDLATLLWEADRLSEHDLEPEQRRWFDGIVDFLERVWPYDDHDVAELEPEEQAELLELRKLESAVVNIYGALDTATQGTYDEILRSRLERERAEGEKDATIPSRASTAERKAMRLLLERRLVVVRREIAGPFQGLIHATCRGENGSYDLGFDPRGQGRWRCTCEELRGACSHLAALKMIV